MADIKEYIITKSFAVNADVEVDAMSAIIEAIRETRIWDSYRYHDNDGCWYTYDRVREELYEHARSEETVVTEAALIERLNTYRRVMHALYELSPNSEFLTVTIPATINVNGNERITQQHVSFSIDINLVTDKLISRIEETVCSHTLSDAVLCALHELHKALKALQAYLPVRKPKGEYEFILLSQKTQEEEWDC